MVAAILHVSAAPPPRTGWLVALDAPIPEEPRGARWVLGQGGRHWRVAGRDASGRNVLVRGDAVPPSLGLCSLTAETAIE